MRSACSGGRSVLHGRAPFVVRVLQVLGKLLALELNRKDAMVNQALDRLGVRFAINDLLAPRGRPRRANHAVAIAIIDAQGVDALRMLRERGPAGAVGSKRHTKRRS
jgi:hypothetical protein